MIHDHIEIDIHKRSVFILGDPDSVFEHITPVSLEWFMMVCCSVSWIQSK